MKKFKFTKKGYKQIAASALFGLLIAFVILYIFMLHPQRTFTITETYRLTSAIGEETYLRVTLPVSGGYQEIGNVLVEGAESYTVEYFNGWRDIIARVPSTGYEVTVTISYTATLFRNARPWEGEVLDEDLLPQQFIDSDNEAIIAVAAGLRGDSDLQTARNIQDYVVDLLSWPTGPRINMGRLYASELLEYREGVCGDFANLMTALLRAEGIPARSVGGLDLQIPLRRASDWGHQGGAHSWVEFFADGKWHFADPSWGMFNRTATTHLSFGVFCGYIFSDFQANRHQELEDRGFPSVGGMTAPLKFQRFSTDENASYVIPRAEVSWSLIR